MTRRTRGNRVNANNRVCVQVASGVTVWLTRKKIEHVKNYTMYILQKQATKTSRRLGGYEPGRQDHNATRAWSEGPQRVRSSVERECSGFDRTYDWTMQMKRSETSVWRVTNLHPAETMIHLLARGETLETF